MTSDWTWDDGGRRAAGFRGDAGDCGVRSVAIATLRPYREVYDDFADRMAALGHARSARRGIPKTVMDEYLDACGWKWVPVMRIGTGCTMRLCRDDLALHAGPIITRLSRHYAAVVDGVVHDTHDPSRDGTRCVYGYWRPETIEALEAWVNCRSVRPQR